MILYNFPQVQMGEKCIQVDKCFFFYILQFLHLSFTKDLWCWVKKTTTTHIQFEIFIADKFNFPF